jgi:Helix-turn-helix domain
MSVIPQLSWQQSFLQVLPAVLTHAKIQFRRLGAQRREEAIQETIATACVNYQLAAAQGKLNVVRPGSLADFAVKHVRAGRRVGGHQDAARDVMSPVCQRRHRVEVVSIDHHRLPASLRNGTDGWRQLVLADRKVPVPDLAAFRVDFGQWFQTRSRRDRSIISWLIAGESPSVVADRFGISRGRVSQLRRRYEQEWRTFQGETSGEAA